MYQEFWSQKSRRTGYLFYHTQTKRIRNLGCGFFFVLELVGFEQVGRPQTAKNSPADCFLDRGLRIHQLPPKSCGKDIATAFFLCCIAQNRQRKWPIFKVRFIEMSNCFRAVGFFCCNLFCCFQNVKAIPHNSKCRYGEQGAAAAGAVLEPLGGNCAVLPQISPQPETVEWFMPIL